MIFRMGLLWMFCSLAIGGSSSRAQGGCPSPERMTFKDAQEVDCANPWEKICHGLAYEEDSKKTWLRIDRIEQNDQRVYNLPRTVFTPEEVERMRRDPVFFRDLVTIYKAGNRDCDSDSAVTDEKCIKYALVAFSGEVRNQALYNYSDWKGWQRWKQRLSSTGRIRMRIREHALFSEFVLRESNKLQEAAAPPEVWEQIRDIEFPRAKLAMIAFIKDKFGSRPEAAEKMIERISGLKFLGVDCVGISMLNPNAYLDLAKGGVRVCGSYLAKEPSILEIRDTLFHEMAHAIDPQLGPKEAILAYGPLVGCLRSSLSVAARKSSFGSTQRDQIGESFADWVSAELKALEPEFNPDLKEVLQGKGVRRGLFFDSFRTGFCSPTPIFPESERKRHYKDSHPFNEDRINRIFFAQPGLRRAFGCSERAPGIAHCTVNGAE